MNILALETSTEFCSVALLRNDILTARSEQAGQRHSEILLPMIDSLLSEAGMTLRKLDGLAFGAGPGSFTGVRIAASVAQGLALGAGIPALPVSTLEALAEASGHERVVAALDARLDEVYFAAYEKRGGDWHPVISPCLSAIGDLPALPGEGWMTAGSGFFILDGELARHLRVEMPVEAAVPDARAVAALGARLLKAGKALDPALAQPVYLRQKVAMTIEERRLKGYR